MWILNYKIGIARGATGYVTIKWLNDLQGAFCRSMCREGHATHATT
ncbi:MAG: hypothetical protein NTV68_11810 [Methanomicrobiales archaeon]|nr:hypothetical protein [Methanomicrobiales archaeon]